MILIEMSGVVCCGDDLGACVWVIQCMLVEGCLLVLEWLVQQKCGYLPWRVCALDGHQDAAHRHERTSSYCRTIITSKHCRRQHDVHSFGHPLNCSYSGTVLGRTKHFLSYYLQC